MRIATIALVIFTNVFALAQQVADLLLDSDDRSSKTEVTFLSTRFKR